MLSGLKNKYWWSLRSYQFNLVFVILTLLVYNPVFWKSYWNLVPGGWFAFWGVVCLILLFNAATSILMFKFSSKLWAIVLTLINASLMYFMMTYKVSIDKIMLLNLIETDVAEMREICGFSMLWYLVLLGVLPAILIAKTKIVYASWSRELARRLLVVMVSLLVVAGIVFSGYKNTAQFMRNNKHIKYLLLPVNYIGAVVSLIKLKQMGGSGVIVKIGEDAKLERYWKNKDKKNLVVWVVGETARTANWGMSGYARDTTEPLNKYRDEIINYKKTTACGTSTGIALPCMFDLNGREDFKLQKAINSENVLDVAQKAGYKVWWRDNNSGCKGVCKRVETEDSCPGKPNCYDEVLLQGLSQRIAAEKQDMLVVLHQKGSHGPTYYLRYPETSERYKPACKTERLDKCSQEEIVNVYDNTIYYSAENLVGVIAEMKKLAVDYNLVMIYVSDHGESLGENGIYLHAAPYMIAPDEQIDVPMMLWMNDETIENLGLDRQCLKAEENAEVSQDNLFHSVLGLLGVKTSLYDQKLDLFAGCRK